MYIFDLDGTLALIDHRRHFVTKPNHNWKAFNEACVDDLPNTPVIKILSLIHQQSIPWVIYSGREATVREQTLDWLMTHLSGLNPKLTREDLDARLTMRSVGNYIPDDVLKESWLLDMDLTTRCSIQGVFDDRDKVVKMWRRHGLTVFQVAEGDF